MSASHTLAPDPRFPVGTVLSIYPGEHRRMAPGGAAFTTGTIGADRRVTFTDLQYDTRYTAAATVNGRWLTTLFTTIASPVTNDEILTVLSETSVNAKSPEYGAVGDGTTDDTTALQAALTAAAGGRLVVPPGTYKITAGLTVPDGASLDLDFADGAELSFATAPTSTILLSGAGTEATAVNLSANAAVAATSVSVTAGAEAGFAAGDEIKIGSTAVYDVGRTDQPIGEIAIVASTSSGTINLKSPLAGGPYNTADTATIAKRTPKRQITLKGGKITGGGAATQHVGMRIDRGSTIRVIGTIFKDVEDQALSFYDCIDVTVDAVSVTGSNYSGRGYGVFFAWCCQDSTVANSYFRDCRHMVTTGGGTSRKGLARRITYSSNHGWDLQGDAIDTHAACEEVTIVGNTINDVTGIGINVDGPQATVIGNTINTTSSHGIYLHNETTGPTDYRCSGNLVTEAGSDGIRFSNGGTSGSGLTIRSIVIVGNSVYSPGGIGVRASNTSAGRFHSLTVANNVIRSATSVTANVYVIKFDHATISGNVVTDVPATQIAIRAEDITKSTITGNTTGHASLSTGFGIRVLSGTDVTVVGNTIKDAGTGIALDSASTFCSVAANNVRGCTTPLSLSTGAGNDAANNVGGTLATVASAATMALVGSENGIVKISGTTTINTITATGLEGRRVHLLFLAAASVTEVGNVKLSAAWTSSADDVLTLVCDGTSWYETARSAN